MAGGPGRGPLPAHLGPDGRGQMAGPVAGGQVFLGAHLETLSAGATDPTEDVVFGAFYCPVPMRITGICWYMRDVTGAIQFGAYRSSDTTVANGTLLQSALANPGTDNVGAIIGGASGDRVTGSQTLSGSRIIDAGQYLLFRAIVEAGEAANDFSAFAVGTPLRPLVNSNDMLGSGSAFTDPRTRSVGKPIAANRVTGNYTAITFGTLNHSAGDAATDRIRAGLVMPFSFRIHEVQWSTAGAAVASSPTAEVSFGLHKRANASFVHSATDAATDLLSADVDLDANDDANALASGTTPTLIDAERTVDRGDALFLAFTTDAAAAYDGLTVTVIGHARGFVNSAEESD